MEYNKISQSALILLVLIPTALVPVALADADDIDHSDIINRSNTVNSIVTNGDYKDNQDVKKSQWSKIFENRDQVCTPAGQQCDSSSQCCGSCVCLRAVPPICGYCAVNKDKDLKKSLRSKIFETRDQACIPAGQQCVSSSQCCGNCVCLRAVPALCGSC